MSCFIDVVAACRLTFRTRVKELAGTANLGGVPIIACPHVMSCVVVVKEVRIGWLVVVDQQGAGTLVLQFLKRSANVYMGDGCRLQGSRLPVKLPPLPSGITKLRSTITQLVESQYLEVSSQQNGTIDTL